ncbi:MAG: hypothetical protein RMM29_04915 [Planctomycetota bacterium]|nr:hypothetical protein [Planctomycetota bacterium]MDW8372976.1 hypothetical protein [Planctomycetota bacterium]
MSQFLRSRAMLLALLLGRLAAIDETAALIADAQRWLLAQQRSDGGIAAPYFSLGITELALLAWRTEPQAVPIEDPAVQRAVAFIRAHVQPDGGIYVPREGLGLYGTGLGIQALRAAKALDSATADRARRFLYGLQDLTSRSPTYGGFTYHPDASYSSADLHNTMTAIISLRAAGVPAQEPRLRAALHFISMCQDLSPPSSDHDPFLAASDLPQPSPAAHRLRSWVRGSGGATSRPVILHPSDAAEQHADDSGRHPSVYGSMTYAMLESYLALELMPDDPRVRAGLDWVERHWTLDRNPGLPEPDALAGLFYSYTAMSRALELAGVGRLRTAEGREIDWRRELAQALQQRAQRDQHGVFWCNTHPRWGESLPALVTAYALISLKRCAGR